MSDRDRRLKYKLSIRIGMKKRTRCFEYSRYVAFISIVVLIRFSWSQPQNWLHFYRYGDLNDPMNSLQITRNDFIYCSGILGEKTLYRLTPDSNSTCQTNIVPIASFPTYDVCHFIYSEDSACVYLFTPDSICKLNPINPALTAAVFKPAKRLIFRSLLDVRETGTYVSCDNGDVYLFKDDSLLLVGRPFNGTYISLQCLDSQNRLWFSTLQNGLLYFKNGTWSFFNKDNSGLVSNNYGVYPATVIFEYQDNSIFAGSLDSGLQVYDGTVWKTFSPQPSTLSKRHVRCCTSDRNGAIWVGANGGTLRFFNNQWYTYTQEDYFNYHAPYFYTVNVGVDQKNRVWFAMAHDGIFMLDQSATPSQCISTKRIKFTSPISLESIISGSRDTISWNTYGNIDSVFLTYKTDMTSGWTRVAPTEVFFNRSFIIWTTPTKISSNYYMRIQDYEDTTVQDIVGPFSIVAEGVNLPPRFQSLPDSVTVKKNQQSTLTLHATDPDGDALTFTSSTLSVWVTLRDSVLTFEPESGSESFTITVTVSDGKGGTAVDSVKVVVVQSTAESRYAFNNTTNNFFIRVSPIAIRVFTPASSKLESVSLHDLSGRLVGLFVRKNECSFELDRSHKAVPNGIYLLRVTPENGHGSAVPRTRSVYW